MLKPKIKIKQCSGCALFKPRHLADPWPIAGVPSKANGKCCDPSTKENFGAWRRATDWCWHWKRKEGRMR